MDAHPCAVPYFSALIKGGVLYSKQGVLLILGGSLYSHY